MALQETQLFEDEPALIRYLPELNNLRMAGKLTDLTIELRENVKLHAHSIVLAARVPSLRDTVCETPRRKQALVLQWLKVSSDAAEELIHYVYTGQLAVHQANAVGLIVLSQQLEMPQVEAWVVTFMATRLDSENLANTWNLAQLLNNEKLRHACLQHIKATFEDTVSSDLFIQLPPDDVLFLLRADDLQVHSEESALRAIGRWMSPLGKVDEKRLVHAEAMMKEVRWNEVDKDVRCRLQDENEGFWNKNMECLRLLVRITSWIECPSWRADKQCPYNTTRRRPCDSICTNTEDVSHIYCLARSATSKKDVLSRYDADTNTLEKLAEVEIRLVAAFVAVEDCIFAIGGSPHDGTLAHVDKFDIKTRRWSSCAPLSAGRWGHAAVAVPVGQERVICVCGGLINSAFSNLYELFWPQEDRWYALPGLKQSRSYSAAVAMPDGRVFVIGGSTDSNWLSSVEVCHLREPADWQGEQQHAPDGFWTNAAPMRSPRRSHAAVVFKDCIFVVGGTDDEGDLLNSVEVFSPPDDRQPLGQWTRLTNQNMKWHHVSLVVWRDRLFAFNSDEDDSNNVREFIPPSSQFRSWKWSNWGTVHTLNYFRGAFILKNL